MKLYTQKQIDFVLDLKKKYPKLLTVMYFFIAVSLLNGLRFIFLIFTEGFKIAYLIEIIIAFGLAIFTYLIIQEVNKQKN